MHDVLESICSELDQLAAQVNSSIQSDEPFGIVHSSWNFPGVTRSELADVASSIAVLIRERGGDDLGESEARLSDYPRRIKFLRDSTVPNIWGNPAAGVPAYLLTLECLRAAVAPALTADPHEEIAAALRRMTGKVRALEAQLRDLGPRSETLESMVERIEHAHEAADTLPTDLATLREARDKMNQLLRDSERDHAQIVAAREEADAHELHLKASGDQAAAIVARCDAAYSAATSQGLAAAFAERSRKLDQSMWAWVFGLVAALVLGGMFGSARLRELSALIQTPTAPDAMVALNLLLSLLSVGGAVWFAWLATKQVGQRFRLSEDYAFKASISRAYEGYRREAARIDKDMEASLLGSALTRLDELPLRLVESTAHSSPWHELLSSDVVKAAVKSVPNFVGNVTEMAKHALAREGSQKSNVEPLPRKATPEAHGRAEQE